ncbi:hypothetical protein MMC26_004979 [Xylographa opegraphella]|nr:hypothetical protein [Xylographa opegraphella]
MLHWGSWPINALPSWSALNNVELNGVAISVMEADRGSGIVTLKDTDAKDPVLMTVPRELVLSLETIWEFAKSDQDLNRILHAVGDFGQNARGAILVFLLIQVTASSSDVARRIGNAHPWYDYIRFLPTNFSMPTFWTDEERKLLRGTSLAPALRNKLKAIDREFAHLRTATESLECCKAWWDADFGYLTIQDYLRVDALYRSRAMDLPGTGLALVPCIDMANHGSGDATNALYETNAHGNAILVLATGKAPKAGEELLITYGDDKGACEMVFSYGFIDPNLEDARSLFLGIEIPDDDPLKLAKIEAFDAAPGFRVYKSYGELSWYGPFVWLQCVNEEDGLEFRVLQCNNGERELQVLWEGAIIDGVLALEKCLERSNMWDVFRLRAYVAIVERIKIQLEAHEAVNEERTKLTTAEQIVRPEFEKIALALSRLEAKLLRQAVTEFEDTIVHLLSTAEVKRYLNAEEIMNEPVQAVGNANEDDFS